MGRLLGRFAWLVLLSVAAVILPSSLAAQIGGAELSTTRGPIGVNARGERTFSISGRVLDEATNLGILRARVTVSRFTGLFVQEAYLDTQGTFMFSDLTRGTYYITASHPDYEDKQETVQLVSAPVMGLMLSLRRKAGASPALHIEPLDVNQHLIPKPARKEFEKGAEQYQRRNLPQALVHFNNAIELHPTYVSALNAKGVTHLRLGEVEAARPCFERAVEFNSNAAAPRVFLGAIYNADRRYPEAEQHLLRALQLNPKSGLAYFELSRAYWGLENLEKADEASRRAHELSPGIPQVHLVRANVFLARRQYEKALGEFDEFLSLVSSGPLADHVRQRRAQLQQQLASAPQP